MDEKDLKKKMKTLYVLPTKPFVRRMATAIIASAPVPAPVMEENVPVAVSPVPFMATPYRVSTITCNGTIGKGVGAVFLDALYKVVPIVEKDTDAVGFIYMIDKDGKEMKGVSPRRVKKTLVKTENEADIFKKRRFDNAVSGYFQMEKGYCPSVKIFKNGSIQMTGVKKIEDGIRLNEMVYETMKKIVEEQETLKEKEEPYEEVVATPALETGNFSVRLINTDFSISYHIRRKELHQLLISDRYQNTSSFQPGTYPGVKLQYYWNSAMGGKDGRCRCVGKCFGKGDGSGDGECKKITVSIFESGKILITGAILFEQIDEAHEYVCSILKEHQTSLEKTVKSVS